MSEIDEDDANDLKEFKTGERGICYLTEGHEIVFDERTTYERFFPPA